MRILGIDFGEKRIGIAVTDEKGEFAFPYIVLENNKTVIEAIKKIIEKEKVKKIILGLPLDLKNKLTHATRGALKFKLELEKAIVVPVIFEKEFYTTKEAERTQGKIKNIDASAAALILKHYLEVSSPSKKRRKKLN